MAGDGHGTLLAHQPSLPGFKKIMLEIQSAAEPPITGARKMEQPADNLCAPKSNLTVESSKPFHSPQRRAATRGSGVTLKQAEFGANGNLLGAGGHEFEFRAPTNVLQLLISTAFTKWIERGEHLLSKQGLLWNDIAFGGPRGV